MKLKSILFHTLAALCILFFSCRTNELESKVVTEAELRASTEFKEVIAATKTKTVDAVIVFEDNRLNRITRLPIRESQTELAKIKVESQEHKRIRLEMTESHRKRYEERKLNPQSISAADFNKITIENERKIYESSALPDSVKQIYIASLYKKDSIVLLLAEKMVKLANKFPSVRSVEGNLILKKLLSEELNKTAKK